MFSLKKRSQFVVVILSMVTFGIYGLIWFASVTNEIEATIQQKTGACRSGGMAILFSILTCGIYNYYWIQKQAERIHQIGNEVGVPVPNNASSWFLLAWFVTPLIPEILLQGEINKIVDALQAQGRI